MIWDVWKTQTYDFSKEIKSNQVGILIALGVLCEALGGVLLLKQPQMVRSWSMGTPTDLPSEGDVKEPINTSQIWVDVGGAVNQPGIYQLPNNSLVAEAIEQAGGLAKTADPSYITQQLNLAESVKAGSKLYIPSQAERQFQGQVAEWCQNQLNTSSVTANQSQNTDGLVSINQASREELMSLTGIGEKRADDIIQNRPYEKVDELVEKDVISGNLLSEIESQISL